jgi:hypothetical protein
MRVLHHFPGFTLVMPIRAWAGEAPGELIGGFLDEVRVA